jgi:hypothetical protein
MLMNCHLKTLVSWASIGFSLLSAYWWYRASVAVVTDEKSGHNPGVELEFEDKKGRTVRIVASAMEQSRLNKIAAIWTAIAVSLQAITTALPSE